MSDVDAAQIKVLLAEIVDEKLGAYFRTTGFRQMGGIITLVIAVALAWAHLNARVDNIDDYGSKADQQRTILLIRLCEKNGVPYEDVFK